MEEVQVNTKVHEAPIDEQIATWSDAVTGSKYIKFEDAEPKTLIIRNWKLMWKNIEFEGKSSKKVEFSAEVINEDGSECVSDPKTLTTVSNPFKSELRPILKDLHPSNPVKLRIIRMGTGKSTKYNVKKLLE